MAIFEKNDWYSRDKNYCLCVPFFEILTLIVRKIFCLENVKNGLKKYFSWSYSGMSRWVLYFKLEFFWVTNTKVEQQPCPEQSWYPQLPRRHKWCLLQIHQRYECLGKNIFLAKKQSRNKFWSSLILQSLLQAMMLCPCAHHGPIKMQHCFDHMNLQTSPFPPWFWILWEFRKLYMFQLYISFNYRVNDHCLVSWLHAWNVSLPSIR